jgi:nucleoid DNA-binding protein
MKNYKVEITKMITDPELISEVGRELGLTPEQSRDTIHKVVEAIRKVLDMNGYVCIRRLGRIFLKQRKKQRIKNFEGRIVEVPNTLMIRFFPAQSLRSFVNVKMKKDRELKIQGK